MSRATHSDQEAVSVARDAVRSAEKILVLTGAGVSSESGVPTFRGEKGLWGRHRPESLATPEAFRRDPVLVWEWYAWRRRIVSACAPNAAHRALAALQLRRRNVTIVTQNVDGLHQRALDDARAEGTEPFRGEEGVPLELHGSLFRVRCTRCDYRTPHRGEVDTTGLESLPRCPSCDSVLRPDVVWFGEPLDPRVLTDAASAAGAASLCLVVGTSAVVQPAASLPLATLEAGGSIVEVNPQSTALSRWAIASIRGPAGRVLPLLLDGPETP
jgi:NAD-dependent deacetylase